MSVCCFFCFFFAFLFFLEPAHVLPVCMINLFPLIIYVIQNVIYVSMNFELWPMRRIVNLSSQTLSECTLLHSLVWSTHKSLQTGAEVHTLSFSFLPLQHSLSLTEVGRLQIRQGNSREAVSCKHTWEKLWTLERAYFYGLSWNMKNFCNRYIKKPLDLLDSRKALTL